MADTLTATPPVEDAAYYQQAFAQRLAEIDRSRARTRATLAEIKATLKPSDRKVA